MRALLALTTLISSSACSFAYDFDDLEGLPCPCEPGFVCLEASDRCVLAESVEAYKSCSQDTPQTGDELCPDGFRCVSVNDQGPRCLPQCQPVSYARPDDGARIAAQCDFGFTCWSTEKGGVCSEGICEDNPNNCPGGQRCARFNGAGVCFTTCDVLARQTSCSGDTMCHPIGQSNLTACVVAGSLSSGSICTLPEDGMCQRVNAAGTPLICARPIASTDSILRCAEVCDPSGGGGCAAGVCALVRSDIAPPTNASVGMCQ